MAAQEEIRQALTRVNDPELGRNLVELGMIRDITVSGNKVRIGVALTVPGCPLRQKIHDDVVAEVSRLPGVEEVEVSLSAMTDGEREALGRRLQQQMERPTGILSPTSRTRVIAVGSGKGGVGKSTVTANLAVAVAAQGRQVGLLDADIYGFSIPRILGVTATPQAQADKIIPLLSHGLKVMSIGFFLPEDQPIIWRGPLLIKALQQMLQDVAWGDPEFLFIDLPPGTGDIPLSVSQMLPRSSLLLVTTPQPTSVHVASRAAAFARQANQRILGVIENMAYFVCPHCGKRSHPFGQGGGEFLAAELGVPLLGQIPLREDIREGSDEGKPVAIYEAETEAGRAFTDIARRLLA
ncbi:MAG TPA: Mrp/NBP35 family ATP-binding protein [Firmicutes bacterium]|nr:Mrp/NBP35 family ATP-binding protein [Bacillota bacterium]